MKNTVSNVASAIAAMLLKKSFDEGKTIEIPSLGKQEKVFLPMTAPVIIERPYHPWRYWDVTWTSSGLTTSTATYSLSSQN